MVILLPLMAFLIVSAELRQLSAAAAQRVRQQSSLEPPPPLSEVKAAYMRQKRTLGSLRRIQRAQERKEQYQQQQEHEAGQENMTMMTMTEQMINYSRPVLNEIVDSASHKNNHGGPQSLLDFATIGLASAER
jgi:hypothetical protein